MTQVAIASLNFLYINNLQLSWGSNTSLVVNAGQARDLTNLVDLSLPITTTLDATINGLNGLDTGALANNTNYVVYLIGDSSEYRANGLLLSASFTAPSLPFGYDVFRALGYVRTNGSANFLKFYQTGNATKRTNYWDAGIDVLLGGIETVFTAVDCSAAVIPVDNTAVVFHVDFSPAAGGDAVLFRPTGSTATTAQQVDVVSSVTTSNAQSLQMKMLTKLSGGLPKIDYQNSALLCQTNLYVRAYDYYL